MNKQTNKWSHCQETERLFQEQDEGGYLRIPHNLDYWSQWVHYNLNNITLAVDVGCGKRHGIHLISEKVYGFDSLLFKSKNFIYGVVENLPFHNVPLLICSNTLDHVNNPIKALKEMISSSTMVILSVYTINPLTKPYLCFRDKMHPHHFTEKEVENIIASSGAEIISKYKTSHLSYLPYTTGVSYKLKFFFNYFLGLRFLCYHLRKESEKR